MRKITFIAVSLLCCLWISTALHAQSDIALKGAGGKLSYVSPKDIDGTIGFGAFVDLGTITPAIGLEAGLDYWSKSWDYLLGESSFRDIVLSGRAKYKFDVSDPKFKPYAGAGLSIHLTKSKVEIPVVFIYGIRTGGDMEDSSTKIGLDLLGGTGYQVSEKVDVVGEIMYRIVSDVGQFVISGGFVYWLGQ